MARRKKEAELRGRAFEQAENKIINEDLYKTIISDALFQDQTASSYQGRDLTQEPSAGEWRKGFIILRKRAEERKMILQVGITLGVISLLVLLVLHFLF